ncbi:TPA: hypothetical protein ACJEU7_001474 [Acinetobacter baumannii]|uniref:hypothetical protein n=1 Tax=Acinetobacter baumannii TaxID=470 RepID=UPI001249D973|nr:hypothetical protein [Acinetobacter baumannii]KAB1664763.1 hypothetical protein F8B05_20870 [Acinetobacter baumannii]MCX3035297.1 hypothetical protein [Acinetobacter baumannii]
MSNKKYVCPECGADVVAWADIDAQITYNVTDSGKLEELKIENALQSDGRCGVQCSKCLCYINGNGYIWSCFINN